MIKNYKKTYPLDWSDIDYIQTLSDRYILNSVGYYQEVFFTDETNLELLMKWLQNKAKEYNSIAANIAYELHSDEAHQLK